MATEDHWDTVYRTKASTEVSWYEPHNAKSLELIALCKVPNSAPVIDVGGGASMLVDDLLETGFEQVTVLDVSAAALCVAHKRLGERAKQVTWLAADITQADLPPDNYAVWHDRAVFHFLREEADRRAYVQNAMASIRPQGFLIMATFGPNGPQQCSGLEVVRYSVSGLQAALGDGFELVRCSTELHRTPTDAVQEFVYGVFRKR